MSLLDEFARPCVLLEKTRIPDGEGGYITTWKDGVEFINHQALDTSMEARIAETQGLTSVYSALVDKSVPIEYGDVFRDVETGDTYRVTSDPKDKQAPRSASVQLKFFTAEAYPLPSDDEPG